MCSCSSLTIALVILLALAPVVSPQQWNQWTPQQIQAYRQQQYYNWYWQQQQLLRQQQVAQQTTTHAPQSTPHPWFPYAQTDEKGSVWVGNDNAKILLISRTSFP
ncbi:unnamed protein product [Caenorhabditis bovis]|uniref:Uncharacterized protein n=1 Tax=Caenorhabditis bovis TaxID=2654633 RepID=A0A8S1ETG7_9PELO|nr:unnamed protein product [Caenorhabditis bovis]